MSGEPQPALEVQEIVAACEGVRDAKVKIPTATTKAIPKTRRDRFIRLLLV